jgi:phage terminase large subunit-like protein
MTRMSATGGNVRANLPVAMQYAHDVKNGVVPACVWTKLSVERHLRDLRDAKQRGLYFDAEAAADAIEFFGFLRHSKGEWAGTPIELAPFQQFRFWVLFGWKRTADNMRRFRTCYVSEARKNAKTTEAAGVGLYLLDADGEPGAEVYAAATKRDEAKLCWVEAQRMVEQSPELSRRILHARASDSLYVPDTYSKFVPLGRDKDGTHGLNVHGGIIDEYHRHPNSETFDALDTGTGSRRQSLIYIITTAGTDTYSACGQMEAYAKDVLRGTVTDDAFAAFIYTLDEGDDWLDEATWVKANPNLGVSVKADDLRRGIERAKRVPSAQNAFLRLHMNIWTAAESRWFGVGEWEKCGGVLPKLERRQAFGGIDLASTQDMTAWVLVFPHDADTGYDVTAHFFLPLETAKASTYWADLEQWARDGWLTLTDGNYTDYGFIRERVLKDAAKYDITEIGYDRYNCGNLPIELANEGLEMVEVLQNYTLSNPSKLLETLIGERLINHGGNPVLAWQAANVQLKWGPNEVMRPVKDRKQPEKRIDGIAALVTALERAMHADIAGVEFVAFN